MADPHPGYGLREELVHAVTHGVGLVLSAVGLGVLVARTASRGDARDVLACAVFGVALVLLYGASTLYHGVRRPAAKRALQVADHAAIYVLIAGSYTPFALAGLAGRGGGALLAGVWALAGLGVVLEVARPRAARRLALPLYLAMGWLAVLVLGPLARALGPDGLALLVGGGAAYTLGVVFYAWRRCPYHHAIWHGFVLAGSALHFSCVLAHVVPPAG
ncbi:MAG: hemolysin III family protein [Myxococcota bacterium]|nr:hemolysin III family protein [Myxococcota bacterium]